MDVVHEEEEGKGAERKADRSVLNGLSLHMSEFADMTGVHAELI